MEQGLLNVICPLWGNLAMQGRAEDKVSHRG